MQFLEYVKSRQHNEKHAFNSYPYNFYLGSNYA